MSRLSVEIHKERVDVSLVIKGAIPAKVWIYRGSSTAPEIVQCTAVPADFANAEAYAKGLIELITFSSQLHNSIV